MYSGCSGSGSLDHLNHSGFGPGGAYPSVAYVVQHSVLPSGPLEELDREAPAGRVVEVVVVPVVPDVVGVVADEAFVRVGQAGLVDQVRSLMRAGSSVMRMAVGQPYLEAYPCQCSLGDVRRAC